MSLKKLTKAQPGSYNSEEYIQDYLQHGKFPKIYSDFGSMVKYYAGEPEPCLDLGACTGLMAIYNVVNGRSNTIAIEGNVHDYDRRIEHEKIQYLNFYVNPSNIDWLRNILASGSPTLVTARRVFPEIGLKDVDNVKILAPLFHEFGVKKIVLEGRVDSKNAAASLHNADLEAACFEGYYNVTRKYGNCRMLQMI